jgi:hypothetical protein
VIIPTIIPKPKVKKSVKNPCNNCLDKPSNKKYYIIASISRSLDGYIYSKLGNDNFCGFNCVAQHITNRFKMIEGISLNENLEFYKNQL